jgi:DNA-binding CsgD family transcriptional regulator
MQYDDIANCLQTTEPVVRNFVYNNCDKRKRPLWDRDELKFFTDNYGIMNINELSKILNRSERAIKVFASKLKFIHYDGFEYDNLIWHPNKIQMLKHIYPNRDIGMDDICYILGVKAKSIYNIICKNELNIYRYVPKKFLTAKEYDFIKKNYSIMSTLKIALKLSISEHSVHRYAHVLGLKKKVYKKTIKISERNWTKNQVNLLLNNHSSKSINYLSKIIKRSNQSIQHKIRRLGLDDNLKVYAAGNYKFYYNNKSEIPSKLEYCQFWRYIRSEIKDGYAFQN